MILILLAVIAGVFLLQRRRRQPGEDLPARLLRVSTRWLPAARAEWADALNAELAAITPGWRRWQFSLSTLRVTVLPPPADTFVLRRRLAVGLAATVAVGGTTVLLLPSVALFLTLLTTGMCAAWSLHPARACKVRRSLPQRAVIAVAFAGILAVTVVVVCTAVRYPAATGQPLHPLDVLLAVALPVVYLAAAAVPVTHARLVWLIALGGVGAATLSSTALAVWRNDTGSVHPLFWPPTVLACGVAWIVARKATGLAAAARHTALLTAALTAATQLAVATIAIAAHGWATDRRSPAAAQVGDALSGQIITNIVTWPSIVLAVWLLARLAAGRNLTAERSR